MFTGLIQEVGELVQVASLDGGRRLTMRAPQTAATLSPGGSVAVDGVCLTAIAVEPGGFVVEAVGTTLDRTKIGAYEPGLRVNLELPLAAGDPIGGHFLTGHVDWTVELLKCQDQGETPILRFERPPDFRPYLVGRGAVALDGISLTVAEAEEDWFSTSIIPVTWRGTTLKDRKPGDRLNLEVDLLARYLIEGLQAYLAGTSPSELLESARGSLPGTQRR